MTTTNNGLTVEELNGDTWIECTCGASAWLSKLNQAVIVADKGQLQHRRSCRTRAQLVVSSAQTETAAPVATSRTELETFARNVRQYGLTKGRDQDTLAAVRAGFLSESDAMNTDD